MRAVRAVPLREVLLPAVALLVALSGCSRSGSEHIVRARELVYARKPQAALREYRSALDAVEKSDGPEALRIRAQALRGAADVYWLELHDVPKAVSVYRELVAQAPDAPETAEGHVLLAGILEAHYRDLRGAISELTAALAREPPAASDLRYHVAKLYFELGDYQQSELEARTLIEKFPASELVPHALFELGKLRGEAGDDAGAIQAWVQALERHPDPQVVQSAIARTRKRIAETTPRGVGAHEAFQRAEVHRIVQARTSLEAAGGSAEQAAREHGD